MEYKNLALGLKVDNLGEEFAQNTVIPTVIGVGLKYSVTPETDLLVEANCQTSLWMSLSVRQRPDQWHGHRPGS